MEKVVVSLFLGAVFLGWLLEAAGSFMEAAQSFIGTYWIQLLGVLGFMFFMAVVNHLSNVAQRRAAEKERLKQEKERLKQGKKQEEERLKQEKERLRRQEKQRLKWEQHSIQTNLNNIVSASKKAAAELPELVRSAEQSLNHAEHEFKGRGFRTLLGRS